jgi:tetratricopeptide (TPR) repeat protein
MTFREIDNLRKQGRLEEAYRLARQALENAPEDLWLKRGMGWVLYDLIKRELREVHEEEEVEQLADTVNVNLRRVHRYFTEFRQLSLPLEDNVIRSQMLRLAVQAQKAGWKGFLDFVEWWGLEHLASEDWEPSQTEDGRELPCLALRVLYALGRVLRSLPPQDSRVTWILEHLQEGLSCYLDDQWLLRSKGFALAKLARFNEAREVMIQVLRKNPGEWWRWREMGELLEADDPEQAIMCYYHACTLERDKGKLVGVYLRLAQLLAAQARYDEAAWCAERARATRESRGWRIPQELQELLDTDWFCTHRNAPEPQIHTERFATLFLMGIREEDVEYRRAVLDHHNAQKGLAYFLWSPREGTAVRYNRFPEIQKASVGTMAELEIAHHEERTLVIACRLIPFQEIPNFAVQVRGRLRRRAGQNHGFVHTDTGERYFVPPKTVGTLPDGARVEATCVYKYNPERDQESWVVLSLTPVA